MNRTSLVLAFGMALAFAAPAAMLTIDPPAAIADADELASWDKQLDKTLEKIAKEWVKLAKWCEKKELGYTSLYVKRQIFHFLPDHEETREFFGYERRKDEEGNARWWQNEIRKDDLKAGFLDINDPTAEGFTKNFDKAEKKIGGWFASLARKAEKEIEDAEARAKKFPEEAAALHRDIDGWKERTRIAWEWVLVADRDNKEAHERLGSPQHNGKYVTPFALPFVERRDERKKAAEGIASKVFEAEGVEADGLLIQAGLSGGANKSEHITILATQGPEFAAAMVQGAEKGLEDLVETYGFPEMIKQRVPVRRINSVKDDDEFIRMALAAGWDKEKAKDAAERFGAGVGVGPGERMGKANSQPSGVDIASNTCTSLTLRTVCRQVAISDVGQGSVPEVEDWLWQTVSYDITKRVLGTALTIWAGDPRYGRKFQPRPGVDAWIQRARYDVELDDDPPFSRFPGLKIVEQHFRAEHTVKGYAMIQYLFEKDPETARKFVWTALAKGTGASLQEVYGCSFEEMDDRYHEWIIKTH